MIQRIELWDFESHEHTVIEDIPSGLSVICGDSNAGKTSVVRALKLAAYNEFDPRSVRVGATKCVVQVDTERGRVKVTRGPKHNLWEVTKTGQPTQYFDKVGVNVVPEAVEVIGLKIVKLGDVEIPVNIMDQLESHFMLSSVGGKDASGSMRAQIVDEISGLSGIESIIKDVSLDNHRFGREIKETEKQIEGVRGQLHPQAVLDVESKTLADADRELSEHKTMSDMAASGQEVLNQWQHGTAAVVVLEDRLNRMPNADLAKSELDKADKGLVLIGVGVVVCREAVAASRRFGEIEDRLCKIPDTDAAQLELGKVDEKLKLLGVGLTICREAAEESRRLNEIEDRLRIISGVDMAIDLLNGSKESIERATASFQLFQQWTQANRRVLELETMLADIEDSLGSQVWLDVAQKSSHKAGEMWAVLEAANLLHSSLQRNQQLLDDCERKLAAAVAERDTILKSVKTCPLTLRPVLKECLEGLTA